MWDAHLREVAAWLITLADNQLTNGKEGYAWHRREEFKDRPGYEDLPRYIKEARKERADAAAKHPVPGPSSGDE